MEDWVEGRGVGRVGLRGEGRGDYWVRIRDRNGGRGEGEGRVNWVLVDSIVNIYSICANGDRKGG